LFPELSKMDNILKLEKISHLISILNFLFHRRNPGQSSTFRALSHRG
jgi:hypothetical protein